MINWKLLENKNWQHFFQYRSTEKYKNQNVIRNQQDQGKLSCTCVWSILFKLHRLHQTVQKKHGSSDLQSSVSFDQQLKQQQQKDQQPQDTLGAYQHQHFISQGLKKLQESLVNFRIEESTCCDLYVYTRKNENFILKLEEIYKIPSQQNTSSTETEIQAKNQNVKLSSGVSRRPSYAAADIADGNLLN